MKILICILSLVLGFSTFAAKAKKKPLRVSSAEQAIVIALKYAQDLHLDGDIDAFLRDGEMPTYELDKPKKSESSGNEQITPPVVRQTAFQTYQVRILRTEKSGKTCTQELGIDAGEPLPGAKPFLRNLDTVCE